MVGTGVGVCVVGVKVGGCEKVGCDVGSAGEDGDFVGREIGTWLGRK